MGFSQIRNQLRQQADPEKAAFLSRFFKTGPGEYAEGDKFLGLTVPTTRKLVRPAAELSLADICKFLHSAWHEERLLALLVMVHWFHRGDEEQRKAVYESYRSNIRQVNNWDLVDTSARDIVGGWLADKDRSVLYEMVHSPSLWERRIAVIATYHFIRLQDFADTLRLSELLLEDKEDLIHKATGWMLREVGNRDKSAEENFLRRHAQRMPRTMLRYAIEKFPEKERRAWLRL